MCPRQGDRRQTQPLEEDCGGRKEEKEEKPPSSPPLCVWKEEHEESLELLGRQAGHERKDRQEDSEQAGCVCVQTGGRREEKNWCGVCVFPFPSMPKQGRQEWCV